MSVSNVMKRGLGDVLPRPFELDLLASSPRLQIEVFDRVTERLARMAFDPAAFRPLEHVFLPKRQAPALRRCAVIDPLDMISYLALALLAAPDIETHRPPKSAKAVFSYRFLPRFGDVFDKAYTYGTFLGHVRRRVEEPRTRILATSDIESFYDQLPLDTLAAALTRCSVAPWVSAYLVDLLSFWSAGADRGLPVGSNASRILAEAVLVGVDDELRAARVDYTRFVDDFRMFAPDEGTATEWQDLLRERLRVRGLAVNRAKTRLLEVHAGPRRDDGGVVAQVAPEKKRRPESPPGTTPAPEDKSPRSRKEEPNPGPAPGDDSKPGRRKFRRPSRGEYERLRDLDLARLLGDLGSNPGGVAPAVMDFIVGAIYQRNAAFVQRIPDVAGAHLPFVPYAVSALVATRDLLPEEVRAEVAQRFAALLLTGVAPPAFAALSILELLAAGGYRRPAALAEYLGTPGSGGYLGRVALDGLRECHAELPGGTCLALFDRLDSWGQRAILTLLSAAAGSAECSSLLGKARARAGADPFAGALANALERRVAGEAGPDDDWRRSRRDARG